MNRDRVLLQACLDLLRKCNEGPYVKDALSQIVHYDDSGGNAAMNYIKGKNYQVTRDAWVQLPFEVPLFSVADGLVYTTVPENDVPFGPLLTIGKGWTWDGASFFLFRWFGTPQRWLTPSLYHDALYEAIRRGIVGREFRERIDRFFRDELIKRGVDHWEAQLAYWCVRVGGNFAVRKDVIEREVV